jgi:putative ABC transport system permease protein
VWKNYFKIAWRNILANKLRTAIHLTGLAIGIAVCYIVFSVVSYSYSFDRFHPKKDNIFQVTTLTSYLDNSWPNTGVPFPLGEVVQSDLSGVVDAAHFYTLGAVNVQSGEDGKSLGRNNSVVFSDNGFFRIFEREWLAGDPSNALREPNAVVLTEGSLQQYFPGKTPSQVLGQQLFYMGQDTIPAKVTGVVKNYTQNTDLVFTDFISKASLELLGEDRFHRNNWNSVNSSSQLFILLPEHFSQAEIEADLEKVVVKYIDKEEGSKTAFFIQPLSELHFTHSFPLPRADKSVLKGLSLMGLILLLIASLNFINLETAHAISRSKEVGIRKTLGSSRPQLMQQFLTETFVLIVLAIAISFLLTGFITSYFKEYLPAGLTLSFFSYESLLFLLCLSILLTLLSGIYPAYILGNYPPDTALRAERVSKGGFTFGLFMRRNLTVLQFALSIAFIIGVLAVHQQIRFVSNQELGFDEDVLMYVRTPYLEPAKLQRSLQLKEQLEQQAFVQKASLSSDMVASTSLWTSIVEYTRDEEIRKYQAQVKIIDKDFVEVNGLSLLAGKNIREIEGQMLVNLTAVRTFGFHSPEEAVGELIRYDEKEWEIVGVVQDFHSQSMRESILPMIMYYGTPPYQTVNVRLEAGTSLPHAKESLDKIYKTFFPLEEQGFAFLDEEINRFYQDDARMLKVLSFASIMAILISCMGLFGLTLFTISKRLKELSIRKVLGATITEILLLIYKEYIAVMVLAFVLGSVPAWIFLDRWLQSFSYRINMPWVSFIGAGITALILCLGIVGVHSLRAAQKNPAEILKRE